MTTQKMSNGKLKKEVQSEDMLGNYVDLREIFLKLAGK